jgi:hypothetical protein
VTLAAGVYTDIPATTDRIRDMRGVLLWLVGIPIPVIILLYVFHVI